MDKELIELIFTHIKGLGEGGGELLRWYLLAYYGHSLMVGGIISGTIIFLVKKLYDGCMAETKYTNYIESLAREFGIEDFTVSWASDRHKLLHNIKKLKENQKD